MSNRTLLICLGVLTLILVASSVLAYPRLPEQVAVHWNARGEADGYDGRFMGVVFLPLLTIAVTLLMLVIPSIDPLRRNIQQFRATFNLFVLVFSLYMTCLHALTIAYNLAGPFNMSRWMVPGFAGLFYFVGELVGKAKRNYMIGIRTPWTLASDAVWEATHRRGGMLFKAAAVVSLLGFVMPSAAIWWLLVPVLAVSAYTVIYSYLLYRRLGLQTGTQP
ncbi:MAG: SdpI family protein [Anaerolineae bacterium]|nr:SdpI family protein [Anaerolineae bacterium]